MLSRIDSLFWLKSLILHGNFFFFFVNKGQRRGCKETWDEETCSKTWRLNKDIRHSPLHTRLLCGLLKSEMKEHSGELEGRSLFIARCIVVLPKEGLFGEILELKYRIYTVL